MPSDLGLVLEHVDPSRPHSYQIQARDGLHLPHVDALVEPGLPQPQGGQFQVHLDLVHPFLGADGRNIGRLSARNDPLNKSTDTILRLCSSLSRVS